MKKATFIIIFILLGAQYMAQEGVIASGDLGSKPKIEKKSPNNIDESSNISVVKPSNFIKNSLRISKHGINYNIKKEGIVTIKIFDYNNNEIASLVNRKQKAGPHFANFSTINFSSGIYKYCVSVDGESICSRTLFVK